MYGIIKKIRNWYFVNNLHNFKAFLWTKHFLGKYKYLFEFKKLQFIALIDVIPHALLRSLELSLYIFLDPSRKPIPSPNFLKSFINSVHLYFIVIKYFPLYQLYYANKMGYIHEQYVWIIYIYDYICKIRLIDLTFYVIFPSVRVFVQLANDKTRWTIKSEQNLGEVTHNALTVFWNETFTFWSSFQLRHIMHSMFLRNFDIF